MVKKILPLALVIGIIAAVMWWWPKMGKKTEPINYEGLSQEQLGESLSDDNSLETIKKELDDTEVETVETEADSLDAEIEKL